jgi:hypothetical protein
MGHAKKRTYSVFLRGTASVVLAAFISNFVFHDAWALVSDAPLNARSYAGSSDSEFAVLDASTFTIPSYLGEIVSRFEGDSGRTVIHVQDAHCNFFAQKKISEIIEHIAEEYGVSVLNLEGGAGNYDISPFTSISDLDVRKEVAEYFVGTGEVNGAEYFAVNNPEKAILWGVEDKALYLSNLGVYRDSLSYREKAVGIIGQLDDIFNAFKRKIFSKELLELDAEYTAYKAGKGQFRSYVEHISGFAGKIGVDIDEYPNVRLLSKAMDIEKDIDFERANRDRNAIAHELEKKLSYNEKKELLVKASEFRAKHISSGAFYRYLAAKAGYYGIPLEDRSAFVSYLEYADTYDSLDNRLVVPELESLEEAVREKMYETPIQKELDAHSRNLSLIKNIFELCLTKTDYDRYIQNKDDFSPRLLRDFIRKNASKYDVVFQMPSGIEELEGYLANINGFYEYSFLRDEVFVENMKFSGEIRPAGRSSRNEVAPNAALLMTGGFHTESLSKIFREKGISYVSIMPRFISEKDYTSPYFELLAGNNTTNVERSIRLVLARASNLAIASKLSSIADTAEADIFKATLRVISRMTEIRRDNGNRPFTLELFVSGDELSPIKDAEGRPVVFSFEGAGGVSSGVEKFPIFLSDVFGEKALQIGKAVMDDLPEPGDPRAGFISDRMQAFMGMVVGTGTLFFTAAAWIMSRSGVHSFSNVMLVSGSVTAIFMGMISVGWAAMSLHRRGDEKSQAGGALLSLAIPVLMMFLPEAMKSTVDQQLDPSIPRSSVSEINQTPVDVMEIWQKHWASEEYLLREAIKMFNVSGEEELRGEARELANIALGENYASIVSAFRRGGISEARKFYFDGIWPVIFNRFTLADNGADGAIRDFVRPGHKGPVTLSRIIRSPRQFQPVETPSSHYFEKNRRNIPDGLFEAIYQDALRAILEETRERRIVGPDSALFFSTPKTTDKLGVDTGKKGVKTSDSKHGFWSAPTTHHEDYGIVAQKDRRSGNADLATLFAIMISMMGLFTWSLFAASGMAAVSPLGFFLDNWGKILTGTVLLFSWRNILGAVLSLVSGGRHREEDIDRGSTHAGFGVTMKGNAWALSAEIEARRADLQSHIDSGVTPESFSKKTVAIGEQNTEIIIHNSILSELDKQKVSLQKFIDDAISIRGPTYKDALLAGLSKIDPDTRKTKPLIIDMPEKSPNLFGDCQKNGYIYINTNAPFELWQVGVSHEMMHEAGIFTESDTDEASLASGDLSIMSRLGIDIMTILSDPLLKDLTSAGPVLKVIYAANTGNLLEGIRGNDLRDVLAMKASGRLGRSEIANILAIIGATNEKGPLEGWWIPRAYSVHRIRQTFLDAIRDSLIAKEHRPLAVHFLKDIITDVIEDKKQFSGEHAEFLAAFYGICDAEDEDYLIYIVENAALDARQFDAAVETLGRIAKKQDSADVLAGLLAKTESVVSGKTLRFGGGVSRDGLDGFLVFTEFLLPIPGSYGEDNSVSRTRDNIEKALYNIAANNTNIDIRNARETIAFQRMRVKRRTFSESFRSILRKFGLTLTLVLMLANINNFRVINSGRMLSELPPDVQSAIEEALPDVKEPTQIVDPDLEPESSKTREAERDMPENWDTESNMSPEEDSGRGGTMPPSAIDGITAEVIIGRVLEGEIEVPFFKDIFFHFTKGGSMERPEDLVLKGEGSETGRSRISYRKHVKRGQRLALNVNTRSVITSAKVSALDEKGVPIPEIEVPFTLTGGSIIEFNYAGRVEIECTYTSYERVRAEFVSRGLPENEINDFPDILAISIIKNLREILSSSPEFSGMFSEMVDEDGLTLKEKLNRIASAGFITPTMKAQAAADTMYEYTLYNSDYAIMIHNGRSWGSTWGNILNNGDKVRVICNTGAKMWALMMQRLGESAGYVELNSEILLKGEFLVQMGSGNDHAIGLMEIDGGLYTVETTRFSRMEANKYASGRPGGVEISFMGTGKAAKELSSLDIKPRKEDKSREDDFSQEVESVVEEEKEIESGGDAVLLGEDSIEIFSVERVDLTDLKNFRDTISLSVLAIESSDPDEIFDHLDAALLILDRILFDLRPYGDSERYGDDTSNFYKGLIERLTKLRLNLYGLSRNVFLHPLLREDVDILWMQSELKDIGLHPDQINSIIEEVKKNSDILRKEVVPVTFTFDPGSWFSRRWYSIGVASWLETVLPLIPVLGALLFTGFTSIPSLSILGVALVPAYIFLRPHIRNISFDGWKLSIEFKEHIKHPGAVLALTGATWGVAVCSLFSPGMLLWLASGLAAAHFAWNLRATRAPPEGSEEKVPTSFPAPGIVVDTTYAFLRPDIADIVRGDTNRRYEVDAEVNELKIMLEHFLRSSPNLFEETLRKIAPGFSLGNGDKIEIGYHASGSYKKVFKVKITGPEDKKVSFSMAIKTPISGGYLLETGELEAKLTLQNTGLVPTLGGIFLVEKKGGSYGEILDGVKMGVLEKSIEDGFEAFSVEEFIEGDTVEEVVPFLEPVPENVAEKCIGALTEAFFRLNSEKKKGELYTGPLNLNYFNIKLDNNDNGRAKIVDIGKQISYVDLEEYLLWVFRFYLTSVGSELRTFYSLKPQGIENWPTPEQWMDVLRSIRRKMSTDETIAWERRQKERVISGLDNFLNSLKTEDISETTATESEGDIAIKDMAGKFLDSHEIHAEAREDIEAMLSKESLSKEDKMVLLFFMAGNNILLAGNQPRSGGMVHERINREMAGSFADACKDLYPDSERIQRLAEKYKSDIDRNISAWIKRSFSDLLRALKREKWFLEIDNVNGEVRAGRIVENEKHVFTLGSSGEREKEKIDLLLIEPVIRSRSIGGHSGTYKRLYDVFSINNDMVADIPPVVFMSHSPEEVKDMMLLALELEDPVREQSARVRLAKKQFDVSGMSPSLEEISALKIRGIADHELTHRIHHILDNKMQKDEDWGSFGTVLPKGIKSYEVYGEVIAFLGWMIREDVFFRLSEAVHIASFFADPAKRAEIEREQGASPDVHISAINFIMSKLAEVTGVELSDDMSNIDEAAGRWAQLQFTEKGLSEEFGKILVSVLPRQYGQTLLETINQRTLTDGTGDTTSYHMEKGYNNRTRWPSLEQMKRLSQEVKSLHAASESAAIKSQKAAMEVAKDIGGNVRDWIITPTSSSPGMTSKKTGVVSDIQRMYARSSEYRRSVNINGYVYSDDDKTFKDNLRKALNRTLDQMDETPTGVTPDGDARAIALVPSEKFDAAKDVLNEIDLSRHMGRIVVVRADGIADVNGLVNELHYADIGRGLLHYGRVKESGATARAESVAESVIAHLQAVTGKQLSFSGKAKDFLDAILSGAEALPAIAPMDFKTWVDEHNAFLAIRRSL